MKPTALSLSHSGEGRQAMVLPAQTGILESRLRNRRMAYPDCDDSPAFIKGCRMPAYQLLDAMAEIERTMEKLPAAAGKTPALNAAGRPPLSAGKSSTGNSSREKSTTQVCPIAPLQEQMQTVWFYLVHEYLKSRKKGDSHDHPVHQ